MPNYLSFDFFFDQDKFNFTASRSQGAPPIKPAWKVRTAPKLPPKELPEPEKSTSRPRIEEIPSDKKIPKLASKPKSTPKPKEAPKVDASKATKAAPKV